MSRLGKVLFLFAGISIITLAIGRFILGDWIPFFWILAGLTVLFIAVAVFVDRVLFKEFFSMKTTKHGMNMGVLIVLALALIGIVNYIGVKQNKTWDFSLAKRNTLSEQSVQVVNALKEDLKVSFFYKKGGTENEENRRVFRELIKKYQDLSPKIKLDFFEVNEARAKAEEYGVTKGSGVIFLDYKGHRNRIEKIDEQEMTQAIIKVTRDKNKTIYFTMGHKEYDLDDGKDAHGLNLFKLMIQNNSFNVKTFNTISQPQVPDDADLVAVIGPQQDFSKTEVDALESYLKKGGHLALALESGKAVGLDSILNKLGITPQNNFIKSSFLGFGYIDEPAIGEGFSTSNAITKVFSGTKGAVVRMDWPMDLKISAAPAGISQEVLVKTSNQATAFPKPQISQGKFPSGPFNLMVAVKGKYPDSADSQKEFSLVVVGDAEFMSNYMLYSNMNRDLAMNTMSAMVGEDDLITIAPREIQKTEIKMTSVKESIFFFGVILPIPLIMLLLSLSLWFKRRSA